MKKWEEEVDALKQSMKTMAEDVKADVEELYENVDQINTALKAICEKLGIGATKSEPQPVAEEPVAEEPEVQPEPTVVEPVQLPAQTEKPLVAPKPPLFQEEEDPTFEKLKNLLPVWPDAVDGAFICDKADLAQKRKRAEGIIDLMIDQSVEGKKFLDYGCGEGHVVAVIADQKPAICVGYDIEKQGELTWEDEGSYLLTTDFAKIQEKGPYDMIMLYDVLDHTKGDNTPLVIMNTVERLLAPGGSVFVRCHPWCSRHGGHLYQNLNKAYAHLVFTDGELEKMGLQPWEFQKIKWPMRTYLDIFKTTQLAVKYQVPIRTPTEPFFKEQPEVKKRILESFKANNWPDFQLGVTFIDYHLVKE